jgi:hypothetical protein
VFVFEIVSRYFWVIAIIVTCINIVSLKMRSRRHIKANPELAEGYAVLIRGYLLWMNVPWIVMGIGCTIGGIPAVWYFFRPRDGNPYVLAWFASVFLLWVLGTHWLFFKGGAEMLVKHPGIFSTDIKRPSLVKLLWLASLFGGVIGAVMMWTVDIPLPPFR